MYSVSQTAVAARYRGRELRLTGWWRDGGDDLIVFVHGLGCSKESWRGAWSARALSGCSLLAIDLPGFGASPRPPDFDFDLRSQAALLGSVIDAHASRRICIVAHSMGGTIAALLPSAVGRRIDRLVLVEGRLLHTSCGIAARALRVTPDEFERGLYRQFRRQVAADPRAAFDLDRTDAGVFLASSRSMIEQTTGTGLVARFRAFECPKHFVYGAENRHLGELKALPRPLLHEVPGVGHFVMNDDPGHFYAWLGQRTTGTLD